LAPILREVPFFPPTMLAIDALRRVQERRSQLGIVVDEQGSFIGLVTVEDVAEELFGDILGEHEKPVELFHRIDEHRFLVRGVMPVHEVNRELDLDLPEGPGFTTLAGLVIHEAGHLPRVGETIPLDDVLVAEIVEATPKQVLLVELRRRPSAPEPAEG
ncbi:MAG: transporter associated domain-containing protein, partial [Polyangiales bacterium]